MLAQQQLLLLGIVDSAPSATLLDLRTAGVERLKNLLKNRCAVEKEYQEVLEAHPWMLGSDYKAAERHTNLDDNRIPDFTAVRTYGESRDIIELKQPFLPCLRKDGDFTSDFNQAWNQAERYLSFVQRHWNYLADEKKLRFDNARCLLFFGYQLGEPDTKRLKQRRDTTDEIRITTYDEVIDRAEHWLAMMRTAVDPVPAHVVDRERRKAARKTAPRSRKNGSRKKKLGSTSKRSSAQKRPRKATKSTKVARV